MALVSEIIKDAYRESNLIPLVASPNTNQEAEGLSRLNSLVPALLGGVVGRPVRDLLIGGEYDQTPTDYVPEDARLVLNLSAATTLELDPHPFEGQRLAVTDMGGNLATYNLTLDANGRLIEGAATLALDTNSDAREWVYMAATGWTRITTLALVDTFPFPGGFDDYFILRLAMRLNPRYGRALTAEQRADLMNDEARMQARYRKPRANQRPDRLGLLNESRGSRRSATAAFNGGY